MLLVCHLKINQATIYSTINQINIYLIFNYPLILFNKKRRELIEFAPSNKKAESLFHIYKHLTGHLNRLVKSHQFQNSRSYICQHAILNALDAI